MKRFFVLLLIIALMFCFSAPAETAASFRETASATVSAVNHFINTFYGYEQLFSSMQEVAPEQLYGFFSEEEDIQMLVMAGSEPGSIDFCTIISSTPENLRLAMNCACMLPGTEYMISDGAAGSPTWMDDMMEVAQWCDALYDEAYAAFEGGELYTISYSDNPVFSVELLIAPAEDSTVMMINYYFHNDA